jgi:hypothetical protein
MPSQVYLRVLLAPQVQLPLLKSLPPEFLEVLVDPEGLGGRAVQVQDTEMRMIGVLKYTVQHKTFFTKYNKYNYYIYLN